MRRFNRLAVEGPRCASNAVGILERKGGILKKEEDTKKRDGLDCETDWCRMKGELEGLFFFFFLRRYFKVLRSAKSHTALVTVFHLQCFHYFELNFMSANR